MMRRFCGLMAAVCSLLFALIVFVLQSVQPEYDGRIQLMSELVFGAHGTWMYAAFAALGVSAACLVPCFRSVYRDAMPTRALMSLLLAAAAAGFVQAGVITLAIDPDLHIAGVFIAFLTSLVAIYVVFRQARPRQLRLVSFGLGMCSLAALVLGLLDVFSPGTAQRLTAAGIVLWLTVCGGFFTRYNLDL